MALELETVHWDSRVDSVFDEGSDGGVPHYNYRIQSSAERLGSSNLEVFVEEDLDTAAESGGRSSSSNGVCSPPHSAAEDQEDSAFGSYRVNNGSSSSMGLKYHSLPGEWTHLAMHSNSTANGM